MPQYSLTQIASIAYSSIGVWPTAMVRHFR